MGGEASTGEGDGEGGGGEGDSGGGEGEGGGGDGEGGGGEGATWKLQLQQGSGPVPAGVGGVVAVLGSI